MDNPLNEFTVDTNPQEMQPDDAAIGIPSTQQPEGATLEAVLGQQEAPKDGTQPNDQQPQGKQAGWIQKRIQEGVQKQLQVVLAEERAKIAAEYDAKLKPLQDSILGREADDLVSQGEFKSRERALEYLRLKNGLPAASQEPEKPAQPARNDKGQFTQTNPTAPGDTEAYGQVLIAQVKAIEAASGINVMDIYNADPEVKRRILSREWDFTDVYKHASGGNQPGGYQPTLPTPSRRPNGSGVASRPINEYSSEQFKKINDFLAQGGVIDLRT
jgi:hypothetical protein